MPLLSTLAGARGFGRGQGKSLPTVTGGTAFSDGGFIYRRFTSSSDLIITGGSLIGADWIMVGGGGGGGAMTSSTGGGGGGGAGGFRAFSSQSLAPGTYPVIIGAGGPGGYRTSNGTQVASQNGNDTTFNSLSAAGGGRGSGYQSHNWYAPGDGGSGGGSSLGHSTSIVGLGNTPSTTPSQGNNGGTSRYENSERSNGNGGGGGAGGVGGSPANQVAGANGGPGTGAYSSWASITSSGASGHYAGGGAPSMTSDYNRTYDFGYGGIGGGGNGAVLAAYVYQRSATSGLANTGGGGGGMVGGDVPMTPTINGGSGIFIIRYPVTAVA